MTCVFCVRDVNFKTCGCVIRQQLLGVLQPHLLICWELLMDRTETGGSGLASVLLCAARRAVEVWQLSAWCLGSNQVLGHGEGAAELTERWAVLLKG